MGEVIWQASDSSLIKELHVWVVRFEENSSLWQKIKSLANIGASNKFGRTGQSRLTKMNS